MDQGFHRDGLSLVYIRPRDTKANREMAASLILNDIQSNVGVFPEKSTFIKSV